ncbi:isoamyl acetate-hydrolyzing esterase [Bulinus truncatus]|nr:isoamyl acetate-hydrolyzing esterase [Bulinus truncatus]
MSENKHFCSWPKVFLFGASITEYSFSKQGCWGTLLADFLQRKCDIIVRGFSGYTTRNGKQVLPHLLDASLAKDIVAMTVLLGSNDANDNHYDPRDHVTLEEYESNLKGIVRYAMSQGISSDKVILITPPAFHVDLWAACHGLIGYSDGGRKNELTASYAEVCCKVAIDMGTKHVDLYTEMMKAKDFSIYLSDGLHLSPQGSQLLVDLLKPIITLLTADLPIVWFPFHDHVDKFHINYLINKFLFLIVFSMIIESLISFFKDNK